MKTITKEELQQILEAHRLWLGTDGQEGRRAELSETDFSGADMPEVNLGMAALGGTNFSEANLTMADMSQADLFGASLSGADLSGADLLLANFIEADLSGADLSVADLSGANLTRANLSGAKMPQADLSGANFSGADLSDSDLSSANLSGADLSGANLTQARLLNANLSGANLSGANMLLAPVYSAEFHGANLTNLIIDSVTLSQLPVAVTRNFRDTFQIIDIDRTGEFTTIRTMEFPPVYHQAALAVLSYFASVLGQEYSPKDLRVRMELKHYTVSLILEAATRDTQGRVEESLEICGLVVQGKMVPDALSRDKTHILRLANQLIHARNLVASERRLMEAENEGRDTEVEDMRWLRENIGKLLQHPETRPQSSSRSEAPAARLDAGPHLFLGQVKALMEKRRDLRPELLVVCQKLALKEPDETDISELEKNLAAIRQRAPAVFRQMAEVFYECGMAHGQPAWGRAFLKTIRKE